MSWKLISEQSQHPLHWHYGDPFDEEGNGNVKWGSITASNTGTIGLYNDGRWTVEYYAGDECPRERVDTYPEMLRVVADFMEAHDANERLS